jgi:hypothetical protein
MPGNRNEDAPPRAGDRTGPSLRERPREELVDDLFTASTFAHGETCRIRTFDAVAERAEGPGAAGVRGRSRQGAEGVRNNAMAYTDGKEPTRLEVRRAQRDAAKHHAGLAETASRHWRHRARRQRCHPSPHRNVRRPLALHRDDRRHRGGPLHRAWFRRYRSRCLHPHAGAVQRRRKARGGRYRSAARHRDCCPRPTRGRRGPCCCTRPRGRRTMRKRLR